MSVIATHWRLKRRGSYFDIISFFSLFIVKLWDGASSLRLYGFDPGRSRPLKLGIDGSVLIERSERIESYG